jgi:NADP-dependent aldehyde dehydrogenase
MSLHGKNFIGSRLSNLGDRNYHAVNPSNNESLECDFAIATNEEIHQCCQSAEEAFQSYRNVSGKDKANFLRQIANNIMSLGEDLVKRCVEETGLPEMRIQGERGRTCGQLNLFADLLEEGSWSQPRIDTALPNRHPLPKPDVRSMQRPLGPVAVFGASNFPLAFSTAGGDTASALAAGCPVVYKAHPAHPGVTELVSGAIADAVKSCDLPEGTFSMFHSNAPSGGAELVAHPSIKAVGFTGSLAAGRTIYNTAAARPEPIPVYAEMGSSNPVVILPEAIEKKSEEIATGLSGSVCLGAGQFCTNPGMVILIEDKNSSQFIETLKTSLENSPAGTTVHESIKAGYDKSLQAKLKEQGVTLLTQSSAENQNSKTDVQPALYQATAETLISNPSLQDEVFGPCTFLISCKNKSELNTLMEHLDGQLTASVFAESKDLEDFRALFDSLEQIAGRVIVNQFPTGVEVCSSMFHGGPYPASTDSRSTSVGSLAIHRFTRTICYQNFPQGLLPDELKDQNPLNVRQMVNSKYN